MTSCNDFTRYHSSYWWLVIYNKEITVAHSASFLHQNISTVDLRSKKKKKKKVLSIILLLLLWKKTLITEDLLSSLLIHSFIAEGCSIWRLHDLCMMRVAGSWWSRIYSSSRPAGSSSSTRCGWRIRFSLVGSDAWNLRLWGSTTEDLRYLSVLPPENMCVCVCVLNQWYWHTSKLYLVHKQRSTLGRKFIAA